MKKFSKNRIVVVVALVLSLGFGFTGSNTAFAATTPSLGAAATYGVLGSTYTNTTAGTTINGDVGFTTGPAVAPGGTHTNYGSGAPYATAGTDQGNALTNLNGQACTFTFAPGAINLSTDTTHGTAGVYAPGVYCSSGAMDIGGPLSLSGSGTFIFRPAGTLTSTAGATVSLAGASACDVFWTPTQATTLGANTTLVGTVISNAGITVGANTNWTGRSLAFGGTVTSATDTITVPTCTAPVVPPVVVPPVVVTPTLATLHVIKQVVNNSGGAAVASNFNLHVKLAGSEVVGSPAAGVVAPGTSYSLAAGTYTVSEDATNLPYAQSFSGDCNSSGVVTLAAGANLSCTVVNDDIEPVVVLPASITVVKNVINDNGRTKVVADFPLFVNGTLVTSGVAKVFPVGTYAVTEAGDPNYSQTFSGDCDASGNLVLAAGNNKVCTITNNDIAPVVVVVPKLPKTGFPPQEKSSPWNVIVGAGISALMLSLYLARKKQTI